MPELEYAIVSHNTPTHKGNYATRFGIVGGVFEGAYMSRVASVNGVKEKAIHDFERHFDNARRQWHQRSAFSKWVGNPDIPGVTMGYVRRVVTADPKKAMDELALIHLGGSR